MSLGRIYNNTRIEVPLSAQELQSCKREGKYSGRMFYLLTEVKFRSTVLSIHDVKEEP